MNYSYLRDCCIIISGSTPSRKEPRYFKGDINWFTPKDLSKIKSKYIHEAPEKITLEGYNSCATTMIPAKSLLFTCRAPIGHLAVNKIECCTNQGFKNLVPNEEKIDIEYLFYVILKSVPQIKDLGRGATFKELAKKDLENFKIPLPPLETQKRIAQILDDASEMRDKTQQLLKEYDLLAQSIFLEMFGNPVVNPKNWQLRNLKKSVSIFKDGPFGSNLKSAHYTETGVRIIRLQNIGVNEFVNKSKSFVSETHAEKLRNYTCLPGDILIATMGTPNIRACRFPDYLDKALNKADCLQLRPDPRVAIQDYLLFLINSHGFFHLVSKFFHGQTRSRVSMGQMAKLSIPIPPLDLQYKFVEKINLIEKQKDLAKQELKESEDLFNCLLQKAFKGELV